MASALLLRSSSFFVLVLSFLFWLLKRYCKLYLLDVLNLYFRSRQFEFLVNYGNFQNNHSNIKWIPLVLLICRAIRSQGMKLSSSNLQVLVGNPLVWPSKYYNFSGTFLKAVLRFQVEILWCGTPYSNKIYWLSYI